MPLGSQMLMKLANAIINSITCTNSENAFWQFNYSCGPQIDLIKLSGYQINDPIEAIVSHAMPKLRLHYKSNL